ncbi:MAG: hypothetical protein IJ809_01160 [Clostridia bacterium]|nr:hypothetical protein [Clostridia bacterium]
MFLLYLFLIILFILFMLKIELIAEKKEDLYIEVKIFNFNVYKKIFKEKNNKKKDFLNLPDIITVKKKRVIMKKIMKFFKIVEKKIDVNKAQVQVLISDSNYIVASYYLAFFYTILYMAKNITNKLMINCYYMSQEERVKIKYYIRVSAKLINVVIALIKLVIILYMISKKGVNKNGRASNTKFNDDSHVIN